MTEISQTLETCQTLDTQIEQIAQYKLPVLCNLDSLTSVLNDPDAAAGDVLKLVRFDPVFCLYVQQLAGEKQSGRSGEVIGLDHALSMLGLDGISKLTPQLTPMSEKGSPELSQVLAESLLASEIATQLARLKGTNVREMAASALFARAAEWQLYFQNSESMWRYRQKVSQNPFAVDAVSEQTLGLRLDDFQARLAELFYLPQLNLRAARFSFVSVIKELLKAIRLHRNNQLLLEDCSRELRFQLGAAELLPLLSNRLAQSLCSPWLRNAWGRWVDIAAIHCHKRNNQIKSVVIQSCRNVAQQGIEFPLYRPASGLLGPIDKTPYRGYNTEVTRAKHSVTPKVEADADSAVRLHKRQSAKYSGQNIVLVRRFYRKLLDTPQELGKPRQLVEKTLRLLVEQTPLERVSFVVIGKDGDTVKTLNSVVKNDIEPAPLISTRLSVTRVWKKFAEKQAFLVFSALKHEKYWTQLPGAIRDDERVDFFLLNSIFYKGRVRALLYADMALSRRKLSGDLINDYKRIASGLASALRSIS